MRPQELLNIYPLVIDEIERQRADLQYRFREGVAILKNSLLPNSTNPDIVKKVSNMLLREDALTLDSSGFLKISYNPYYFYSNKRKIVKEDKMVKGIFKFSSVNSHLTINKTELTELIRYNNTSISILTQNIDTNQQFIDLAEEELAKLLKKQNNKVLNFFFKRKYSNQIDIVQDKKIASEKIINTSEEFIETHKLINIVLNDADKIIEKIIIAKLNKLYVTDLVVTYI